MMRLGRMLGMHWDAMAHRSPTAVLLNHMSSTKARSFWKDSSGLQHFEKRGSWLDGKTPWILGGSAATFGAYYLACLETIPYTGRQHSIMLVSRSQEKALGKMVFEMQLEEARREHSLLPDSHPYARLVKAVGMRVAKVATELDPAAKGSVQHMQGLDWEFVVIKSPMANAFVVPGGKVVVFTGLLDLLGSEDELAAVLAHETAHVLARHHAERMSTMNLMSLGQFIFYGLFGFRVPGSLLFLSVFLPYSRRAEHEADAIGLRLMARACHDPWACPTMLGKLGAMEKKMQRGSATLPALLRTHPLSEDRVLHVQKDLPEARRIYQHNCGGLKDHFGGLTAESGRGH